MSSPRSWSPLMIENTPHVASSTWRGRRLRICHDLLPTVSCAGGQFGNGLYILFLCQACENTVSGRILGARRSRCARRRPARRERRPGRPGPPASLVGERALSPSRSDVAGLDALAVVGGARGG